MKANEKMATTPKAKTKAVDSSGNLSKGASKSIDKATAARLRNLSRAGRPKGSKNKVTKAKEAIEARTTGLVEKARTLPLEAMLDLLQETIAEYHGLRDAPAPELMPVFESATAKERADAVAAFAEARKLHAREVRQARSAVLEVAVAAGPYCHAKLQSIDKSVKRNVRIQVISFADAPPLTSKEG